MRLEKLINLSSIKSSSSYSSSSSSICYSKKDLQLANSKIANNLLISMVQGIVLLFINNHEITSIHQIKSQSGIQLMIHPLE